MKEYEKQIKKGAIILNETKKTVTLQLNKRFSLLAFVIWVVLFFIVGGVGYLIYYNLKQGRIVEYIK